MAIASWGLCGRVAYCTPKKKILIGRIVVPNLIRNIWFGKLHIDKSQDQNGSAVRPWISYFVWIDNRLELMFGNCVDWYNCVLRLREKIEKSNKWVIERTKHNASKFGRRVEGDSEPN